MATERQNGVTSDTETSEKPVREQLKKASISQASGQGIIADDGTIPISEATEESAVITETDDSRGRPQRKRSYEHLEGEETAEQQHTQATSRSHNRKRSRDSTVEEHELNDGQRKSFERLKDAPKEASHPSTNGHPKGSAADRPHTPEQTGEKRSEAAVDEMTSPKIKRSRTDATQSENEAEVNALLPIDQPETSADSTSEEKAAPTLGFTNTSAISPFASLPAGSKSPSAERPTSPSAFAASGFSSLVGSSSGFGSIGKSAGGFGSGGGFGTAGSKSAFGGSGGGSNTSTEQANTFASASGTQSASPFGGVLGQQSSFSTAATTAGSAFGGGSSSGFGKLGSGSGLSSGGSGFGSLGAAGTGGLTSFASGKPTSFATSTLASSKPVKAFGAPADPEDEEADEAAEEPDESGFKSPLSQQSEADKQDTRFYEQELSTGEEDEYTAYSCRAKLYNYAASTNSEGKKEWRERGLGVVRLNVRKAAKGEGDDDAKPRARLLMRAEGSHRVILNTPVTKEIKFGTPSGGAPMGGYVFFMGTIDVDGAGKGGLEMLQLKVRQQFATELCEKIGELQAAM